MDAHTDTDLMQGDTSQNALVESFTMDHEHDPGNTVLNEDSDNPSSNVHSSIVTDGGDLDAHERHSPILPFKSDQEPSDIQTERNRTDHEHSCTYPQSNSDQEILLAIPKEVVSPSERAVDPADGAVNINDAEAPTIIHTQESPSLRARIVSPAIPPRDEREADSVDHLNPIQMLHTEADHVQTDGLAHLTEEEKTVEDFDYPCEDFLPSLPPSSSPPQVFSSSPYQSSQSSVGDVEPSKTMLAAEVEGFTNSHDGDCVVLITQDDPRLEPEDLHNRDTAEVVTLPETDKYCSQMGPTSCIGGGLELSRKRIGDPDEPSGSRPIKRPNMDSHLYLPPAPKRATIASQHHQFKKLATPFRPPSKLPAVTDGLPPTMNNRKAESTMGATLETTHDKINPKGTAAPSQHKASKTSRSVTQFKSPLVNGVLPADSRTIRLTPALQALERKLQLLKRAIKVKEDNEEEVLFRLAGKWIEAGREVAYGVWDATKDAGDFSGKAPFIPKSQGWGNTNDKNTPWGWDAKPGDAGEESRDLDPSEASRTIGRLAPEEDDDVGCNTLGTMLRQLGIAPEIFGWDDDTETFSD